MGRSLPHEGVITPRLGPLSTKTRQPPFTPGLPGLVNADFRRRAVRRGNGDKEPVEFLDKETRPRAGTRFQPAEAGQIRFVNHVNDALAAGYVKPPPLGVDKDVIGVMADFGIGGEITVARIKSRDERGHPISYN